MSNLSSILLISSVSIEPAEPAFQTGPKATSIRSAHLQERSVRFLNGTVLLEGVDLVD